MARNPEIEKILEAWWRLQHSLPAERAKSQHQLNELLDLIVAKGQHQHTRDQILDFLWPQYKEYRLERKKREQVGVAQAAMKK